MKVLFQWTVKNPTDWQETSAVKWANLPKKPIPKEGQLGGKNNAPGWIFSLNVQGVGFVGYDHYAVKALPNGGCRVTVWKDDPEYTAGDPLLGEFYARVADFLPLAPDPRFRGAWNTRQRQTIYSGPKLAKFYQDNPTENTKVRPWSDFVPPSERITRHGVWIPNPMVPKHDHAVRAVDWREWTEGAPAKEIIGRKLRPQRPLGRYDKPTGTKTFGLVITDQASGVHAATNENQMTRDAFGASETEASGNIPGAASALTHLRTTLTTEPDDADWPSGIYRCSLDISAVGADLSYGLRTSGAGTGQFARVDSGLTSDSQTFAQTQGLFTGTGIKLATTGIIDPAAGATGDRFEF